ncbi:MAG: hypothetical protein OJF60_002094 [Burkholderiaceae bacterium]|jgi:hypothetical protein|nr:MAG: hypothetical protein OJF60_002094 [Burkholderiaceae bacterium]
MRGLLGLAGLLLALLIVGLLVKKQLAATQLVVPAPTSSTSPVQPGAAGPDTTPTPSLHGQGRQIEQQYRQALDAAMHQTRPAADEK